MKRLVALLLLAIWGQFAFASSAQEYVEKQAIEGDAYAQYRLGFAYLYGTNEVPKDYKKAYQWLSKAAAQGRIDAYPQLAVIYLDGLGRKQDYAQAQKWLEMGATAGDAFAQARLGLMYYRGEGVKKDFSRALPWLKKGAERGNVEAEYALAVMYDQGQGVDKDVEQAAFYMRKAAAGQDVLAQRWLGAHLVEGKIKPEGKQEALKWYRLAALQGDSQSLPHYLDLAEKAGADAQYEVAVMYFMGKGVPQDFDKTFTWLTKAAAGGNANAIHGLAVCYYNGWGVKKDEAKALEYLKQAASLGQPLAQKDLHDKYPDEFAKLFPDPNKQEAVEKQEGASGEEQGPQ